MERLLEGTIDNETYKEAKNKIDIQVLDLKKDLIQLENHNKDGMKFVKFGVHLLKNIDVLFEKSTVFIKQKILSSILREKLIYEQDKFRTPKLNKGFEFIFNSIEDLSAIKNKNGRPSLDDLPFSTEGGT